jgi:hypothetical protein
VAHTTQPMEDLGRLGHQARRSQGRGNYFSYYKLTMGTIFSYYFYLLFSLIFLGIIFSYCFIYYFYLLFLVMIMIIIIINFCYLLFSFFIVYYYYLLLICTIYCLFFSLHLM